MAKFQEIEKVRTAVDGVYKKSLYHRSLSTQGFMALQPYFMRELFPKEKINGKAEVWSRLNTLVLPTFGDCDYHLSKFFVRYKDIWIGWDDFYNRSLHSFGDGTYGYLSERPSFTVAIMFDILTRIEAVEQIPNPAPGQPDPVYDFLYRRSNNNTLYFKWTEKGLPIFSLLTQCGYELSWDESDPRRLDLLPLMALAKIFIDHYFPKRYRDSSVYREIAAMFAYNNSSVYLENNSIYYNGIKTFLDNCLNVYYDNDGVYCAWDNPTGPGTKEMRSISVKDNTNTTMNPMRVDAKSSVMIPDGSPNDENFTPTDNTPFISGSQIVGQQTNYAAGAITKNLLDMLYRISNMVKRYQLAGNSAAARFLARFGFELGDTHESYKLGTHVIPVRVGDVEANSDSQITVGDQTFTSLVGNLAGKGVASNGLQVTYNGDSHAGLYFILMSIVPDAGLYQGLDRRLLNVDIEDTITPDNDALGVRAISVSEVYTSNNGTYNKDRRDSVFGFLPFGWEHCVGRNVLAGAFRLNTQGKAELAPYHLYRDLGYSPEVQESPHIGLTFLNGVDAYQFNRLFYNMYASQQFIIRFRMKYDSVSFKKPLYDSYDWNMDSGNKQVVLDANSIEVN